MNFLAPGWILVAGVASAVVVAIHLISWRLPRVTPLPTARFVPDEPARRAARTVRLTDLALLALRVAILMAGGLALARPVFRSKPGGTARVIAVERTADTTSLRRDLASFPEADRTVHVVFDTTARVVGDEAAALAAAKDSNTIASLSVGLLAAIREARVLARNYETVDVALVSAFDQQAFDAATTGVRATWPDSIQIVQRPLAVVSERATRVEIAGDDDDPVVAGIRLAEANGFVEGSSIVRRAIITTTDSAIAVTGVAFVVWPRLAADSQLVDGIHAGEATAIGHFIRSHLSDSGRVVARWADGEPAAVERPVGAGCVRTIGFDVPDVGDFTITPGFQRLAAALLAPCGSRHAGRLAADSLIAAIANPPAQPSAFALPDERGSANRLAAALMVLAVLLSTIELVVRRRTPARRALESAA